MTNRKYTPGDPDPTPDLGSRMKCPNRAPVSGHENCDHGTLYYECTWPDDEHDPDQHVAGAYSPTGECVIVATWDVNQNREST